MNVRPADPRSHSDSEFHFSEQPQLSEELRMLREQVRRFVEKEVVPETLSVSFNDTAGIHYERFLCPFPMKTRLVSKDTDVTKSDSYECAL